VNAGAASLDRLHDIVLPHALPWWPLAPGGYLLLAALLAACVMLGRRAWRRWRANAYRRAALGELPTLQDGAAIAALLRRTALAIAPREAVAAAIGAEWPRWLAARCAAPMPEPVSRLLAGGVYARADAARDLGALRDYAALWIAGHAAPQPAANDGSSLRGEVD
jgi:hypothetical protein